MDLTKDQAEQVIKILLEYPPEVQDSVWEKIAAKEQPKEIATKPKIPPTGKRIHEQALLSPKERAKKEEAAFLAEQEIPAVKKEAFRIPRREISAITGKPVPTTEELSIPGRALAEVPSALGETLFGRFTREPGRPYAERPEEISARPIELQARETVKKIPGGKFLTGETQLSAEQAEELSAYVPVTTTGIGMMTAKSLIPFVVTMTEEQFVRKFATKYGKEHAKNLASYYRGIIDYLKDVQILPIKKLQEGVEPGYVRYGLFEPTSRIAKIAEVTEEKAGFWKTLGRIIKPLTVTEQRQAEITTHETVAHPLENFLTLDNMFTAILRGEEKNIIFKNADIIIEHWDPLAYGRNYSKQLEIAQTKGDTARVKILQEAQKHADLATLASESFAETLEKLTVPEGAALFGDMLPLMVGRAPKEYKHLQSLMEDYSTRDLKKLDSLINGKIAALGGDVPASLEDAVKVRKLKEDLQVVRKGKVNPQIIDLTEADVVLPKQPVRPADLKMTDKFFIDDMYGNPRSDIVAYEFNIFRGDKAIGVAYMTHKPAEKMLSIDYIKTKPNERIGYRDLKDAQEKLFRDFFPDVERIEGQRVTGFATGSSEPIYINRKPVNTTSKQLRAELEDLSENSIVAKILSKKMAFRFPDGTVAIDDTVDSTARFVEKHGIGPEVKLTQGWSIRGQFIEDYTTAAKVLRQGTVPQHAMDSLVAGKTNLFSMSGIKDMLQGVRDKVTINAVPKLSRIGVQNSVVAHASARNAVKPMVQDLLAKVFPSTYKNPEKMAETINVLVADNILGGYDQFINAAMREGQAGNAQLAGRWQKAAERIASKHDLRALEAQVAQAQQNPEIISNIQRWKQIIEPEMNKLYNELQGVDPLYPREGRGRVFRTRLNLLTTDREASWLKFNADPKATMPESSVLGYLNPHVKADPWSQAAHFTGKYSNNPEAILSSVLGHRWNEVTKFRMYQDLVDNGAALWAEGIPKPTHIQGQNPRMFRVKVPETTSSGITRRVEKGLWIREDIAGELRRVLDTDYVEKQSRIANILTNIQLAQLSDLITHTKNLISVISTALGTGSVWKDVIRQLPFIGTADGIGRLLKVSREVMEDSPAIRAEIAEMAKKGLVRPYFPHTGITSVTKSQEFLYKVDTSARILMNRFFDNLAAAGKVINSEENRFKFINQVGQYNKRLMGDMMRTFRDTGLSPFIVAGRNFNRQGRRRLLGDPGVEASSNLAAAQMRLIHLAGIASLFTVPMMLNTMTTGNPNGRAGTPLGAWDLGGPVDEKGKHQVVDLLQATGVRRGMRSVGFEAALEGIRQEHTPNQILGKMANDISTTAIHPWTGPAVSGTAKAIPILSPSAGPAVWGATTEDYTESFRKFAEDQNPLFYSIMRPAWQAAGFDKNLDKPYLEDVAHTIFLKSPFQAFGVKYVPQAETGAEKEAHNIISSHYHSVMDKSDKEKFAAEAVLVNTLRSGEKPNKDAIRILKNAVEKGYLTAPDIDRITTKGTKSKLEVYLDRLNAKETARVFIAGNRAEKELIMPKLVEKYSAADARVQADILEILKKARIEK